MAAYSSCAYAIEVEVYENRGHDLAGVFWRQQRQCFLIAVMRVDEVFGRTWFVWEKYQIGLGVMVCMKTPCYNEVKYPDFANVAV